MDEIEIPAVNSSPLFKEGRALALDTLDPTLPIEVTNGLHLDVKTARLIGERLAPTYAFAEPFPHIVIDNFLPGDVIRMALQGFPVRPLPSDRTFDMGYAGLHKRQILPEECGPVARTLFQFFNSAPTLQFLEGLSNIVGLLPDPYFVGGGYHETARGGLLGVHADFRLHEQLHLQRRLNMIIYLNEHWSDDWKGHLELWNQKMTRMHSRVAPVFNRCVIFNTNADSYHGHPDPLCTPDGIFRRSMALYYYTASRSIYKEVPKDDTRYQARPSESLVMRREARELAIDFYLRKWTPASLQRYIFAVRRRLRR